MTRRRTSPVLAECGYCVVEGPDENGRYDLIENFACPEHGEAVENREFERWHDDDPDEWEPHEVDANPDEWGAAA